VNPLSIPLAQVIETTREFGRLELIDALGTPHRRGPSTSKFA
jgi:hypothetical protein